MAPVGDRTGCVIRLGRLDFHTMGGNDDPRDDGFDPLAAEEFDTAHDCYARMRAGCPVAHSPVWNGFWTLFRHADVVRVLKDPKTFITSVQNVVPKVAFTGRRPPLHFDPPDHTPYRQVLNPFFTTARMAAFEPELRRITGLLLQTYIERRGGDICEDFAQKLPGHILAVFLNVPLATSERIKQVTVIYNRALQQADDECVKATSLQLYDIAREIIAARKAEPLDPESDITSAFLAKRHKGEPLPEELVLGTIRQLIVVGMIAPSVFIGAVTVHLARDPALQDRLRREPDLIPAALEEFLRLYTPYRGFARTANQDVVIGGCSIHRDEPIALNYTSANRDSEVFPDGDTFILDRPNIGDHIAFGLGPHRCAGESLARLMLRVVIEELLRRTQGIELAGEIVMTRWPEWGTLAAPFRVTPAVSQS